MISSKGLPSHPPMCASTSSSSRETSTPACARERLGGLGRSPERGRVHDERIQVHHAQSPREETRLLSSPLRTGVDPTDPRGHSSTGRRRRSKSDSPWRIRYRMRPVTRARTPWSLLLARGCRGRVRRTPVLGVVLDVLPEPDPPGRQGADRLGERASIDVRDHPALVPAHDLRSLRDPDDGRDDLDHEVDIVPGHLTELGETGCPAGPGDLDVGGDVEDVREPPASRLPHASPGRFLLRHAADGSAV